MRERERRRLLRAQLRGCESDERAKLVHQVCGVSASRPSRQQPRIRYGTGGPLISQKPMGMRGTSVRQSIG